MKTATDMLAMLIIIAFTVVVGIAVIVLSPIILIVIAVYVGQIGRWEESIQSCLAKGVTLTKCEKCPGANARICHELSRNMTIAEMVRRGEIVPSYMLD